MLLHAYMYILIFLNIDIYVYVTKIPNWIPTLFVKDRRSR